MTNLDSKMTRLMSRWQRNHERLMELKENGYDSAGRDDRGNATQPGIADGGLENPSYKEC